MEYKTSDFNHDDIDKWNTSDRTLEKTKATVESSLNRTLCNLMIFDKFDATRLNQSSCISDILALNKAPLVVLHTKGILDGREGVGRFAFLRSRHLPSLRCTLILELEFLFTIIFF